MARCGASSGYGGSKESQDSVSPEFIYSAFVIVDFVNDDFKDLVHQRKGLLRPELFRQRSKPLHVNEHDGDVSPLPLYSISLRQDLFREAARQILLDLCKLFIKGEVCGAAVASVGTRL